MKQYFNSLIYTTLAIDSNEIDPDNKYDQRIIYSLFVRLVLSIFFVFSLSLFALNTMPSLTGLMAFVMSLIIAGIVFGLDSSILASEWELSQGQSSNNFWSKISSSTSKLIRFFIRILFSLGLAWSIASLAELALQKDAIKAILDSQTKVVNREYMLKIEAQEAKHEKIQKVIEDSILTLESKIELSSADNLEIEAGIEKNTTNIKKSEVELLTTNVLAIREKKSTLHDSLQNKLYERNTITGKMTALKEKMHDEIWERSRCPKPHELGSETCKGKRWKNLNKELIALENSSAILSSEISVLENTVNSLNKSLLDNESDMKNAKSSLINSSQRLRVLKAGNLSLPEMKSNLVLRKEELRTIKAEHNKILQNKKDELKQLGFYQKAEYDFLQLHNGLQTLYKDPKLGKGARRFSNGLLLSIILLELAPVIVALFFKPYSHYASKIHIKSEKQKFEEFRAIESIKLAKRVLLLKEAKSKAKFETELSNLENHKNSQTDAEIHQLKREEILLDQQTVNQKKRNNLSNLRFEYASAEDLTNAMNVPAYMQSTSQ